MASIAINVNNTPYTVDADASMPLLWALRDLLGLTGTKYSCGIGVCGTCTVHVDGDAVHSCTLTVSEAAGKAVFGMDVRVPEMLFAAVARCPVFGGALVSFDATDVRALPGVVEVLEITRGASGGRPTRSVAVLARDTWSAIRGREALKVKWDQGSKATLDSSDIEKKLTEGATFPQRDGTLVAYYTVPFFSHSPMEPINSTVRMGDQDCEAWTPTQDPIELRLLMLRDRERAVLDLAVEKSGWGSELPPSHGRGIAIHSSWDVSPCAEVAEVSADENGKVRVLKVTCVIDCGIAINPDMIKAQPEGGIIFGLTAALKAHITISKGRVVQSNFHDYSRLKMDETPEIDTYIVKSTISPTGTGEMANPPIAPAVANAIYAATGKRIRRPPILPDDLASA